MMDLNKQTYFSDRAQKAYFSVSQWKQFEKCEAAALAELRGEYRKEPTTALMVGSYVDAYFSGDLDEFTERHPEIFNSRTGELKADYRKADAMIDRLLDQDLLLIDYLHGETQVIRTAEWMGYPWKIKMDFCDGTKIVDLKTVKDFGNIYDPGYGYRDWISYWGYDLQGAVYQQIEMISSGRPSPLPFYLVAVTKEPVPDVALIRIPQHILDAAIKIHGIEDRIDRYQLIKDGVLEPRRCEHCDWCKETKRITEPVEYEPVEA